MPKFVFISGPPGSGKSTQAKLLRDSLGYTFFDSGDMVRRRIKDGSLQHGEKLERGYLMPIKDVLVFAKQEIGDLANDKNVNLVISGIPRSEGQSFGIDGEEGLVDWLESKYGKDSMLFINLKISEDESLKRTMNRHEGRADDKKSTLENRLKVFKEETLPVFGALRERGYSVVDVDGAPSVEEIHKEIEKYLL